MESIIRSWHRFRDKPEIRAWGQSAITAHLRMLAFIERYPWGAVAIAVPLIVVGLAAVATFPYVFVPLLILACVGLVVLEHYAEKRRDAERRVEVYLHAPRDMVDDPVAQALAEAAAARARAERFRTHAEAAEARALAAEARARTLMEQADTDTDRLPRINLPGQSA
ncbi:hypothetical protein C731_2753 [Mycolicibacterium hassiacum DSM 44199]|uniref:Uncharacterized protein n=1 Tax=Mycolicibacterium hassiacum (strain DSM 44199 / CIP 105218 / JCM 12690 / 3849) TaxID=1122247 RepID=K5BJK1_MYCHD|nr:hypothetical protein [Mycolicibacterium hassiacum]EKF23254.1 hypothetical protein C731_2753 [Mycolicibacterium hassiacum DSM 44199]MBX5489166.1 hypothetical protein [Mycolicibacterium hassiacum]MDA4086472.1 hypothetical protein [Mycolicibacterium hassiacum DSM 44199]PZN19407.1 MAG: hypothetical protein DIU75_14810 [Mycolicibacterium hassiacum]VCT89723.1 hypothetical protein MHAS_01421 [Mycolicibacterium hassiacum DSM 44199]